MARARRRPSPRQQREAEKAAQAMRHMQIEHPTKLIQEKRPLWVHTDRPVRTSEHMEVTSAEGTASAKVESLEEQILKEKMKKKR